MSKKEKIYYICENDLLYEVENDGGKLFDSEKGLLKHKKCCRPEYTENGYPLHCKIIKVKLERIYE